MTASPAAIVMREVDHDYRVGGQTVRALAGINVELATGQLSAITGPSGSGKSTMLNIIGALMRPTSGSVTVAGTPLDAIDARGLRTVRADHIGFIHQRFHLIPHLTASQNIMVALRYTPLATRERRRRVEEALATVGLGHRHEHRPSELSGGEQQRVAIARALATSPAIIIADEPTGNLDSVTGGSILALLREATQEATVIVATHDHAAVDLADRHLSLHDGRLAS